ncbi:RNA pyrophosphohydrolase [Curvivirga aplysinae]|uniref:RNA pyrophosphohydrolase n=1 Tax=Curvivirga aplysinae TaxID=2529852 RepID=UPI0012BD46E6|nr:RNA pyrophosphohydrolase [Curvivirga aplysinae]MTI10343.1 RNA pyrophosphohydrolase [Curvivirga aplysinae]
MTDDRPYRPCVGLMLINDRGDVFVGDRIDTPGAHWQMPQGGIDDGETAEVAALRELEEEIGTAKARILAESEDWYAYDLPKDLSRKIWKGRYRGQKQKWFLLAFEGDDGDIRLDAHYQEFSDWQWAPFDELTDLIVPFKRDTYEKVTTEFRSFVTDYLHGKI